MFPDWSSPQGAKAWQEFFGFIQVCLVALDAALAILMAALGPTARFAKRRAKEKICKFLTEAKEPLNRGLLFLVVATALVTYIEYKADNLVEEFEEQQAELNQQQLQHLSTELTGTKWALADAQAHANEALSRADAAAEKTKSLEQASKPRRLINLNRALFIRLLRRHPPQTVRVSSIINNQEAFAYTMDFVTALREAGWTVEDAGMGRIITMPPWSGIKLQGKNPGVQPRAFQILAGALLGIRLNPTMEIDPNLPDDVPMLRIGQKPTSMPTP